MLDRCDSVVRNKIALNVNGKAQTVNVHARVISEGKRAAGDAVIHAPALA
jgi:hypothetical protein